MAEQGNLANHIALYIDDNRLTGRDTARTGQPPQLEWAGASGLSLSVEERQGHPAQPSVDRRHHLLAHGPGIPLLGGHHGLAQPVRGGLAAVQQYGVVPTSPGTGNVIWSPAPSTEFTETWEYPRQTLTRRRLKSLSSSLTGHRVSSLKT